MIFAGHFEHSIDKKNRLAIPAKYRSRLDSKRDGDGFYVVPGQPPTTLWLYTEQRFEEMAGRPGSSLIPNDDQLRFEQEYFPMAEHVDLDSQGRVLLPEKMIRLAGLSRDVVICGVRDHMEIRPREAFERQVEQNWEGYREAQVRARAVYDQMERQSGRKAGDS